MAMAGVGYFLPSEATLNHDRYYSNFGHATISRPEAGANLP